MVFKGWKITQREKPVRVLFFHFLCMEAVWLPLILVTLFMQFRKRLIHLFMKIFGFFDPGCGLSGACNGKISLVSLTLVLFFVWFVVLLIYSVVKSSIFRRYLLEAIVSGLSFTGIAFLLLAASLKPPSLGDSLLGLVSVFLAGLIAFFTVEKVKVKAESVRAVVPIQPESSHSSILLPLNWVLFLFVIGIWFGSPFWASEPERVTFKSEEYREVAISAHIEPFVRAIDSRDIVHLAALLRDPKSASILADPVWGKQIFFHILSSDSEILEVALKEWAGLPEEFVEHSFPMLASQGNCRAFKRLSKYVRGQTAERSIANLKCPSVSK